MLDIFIPTLIFGYIARYRWLKRPIPYWISLPLLLTLAVLYEAIINEGTGKTQFGWIGITLVTLPLIISQKTQDRMPSLSTSVMVGIAVFCWISAFIIYIALSPYVAGLRSV
jgi:hypothetical protein